MPIYSSTDYNYKNCFSTDKVLFQKNIDKKHRMSARHNNILNKTLSAFSNLFENPTTLENIIKNKLTYNRIHKKLNSSDFPISLTKQKIRNNYDSLSSYKNSKRNKPFLHSFCNNHPESIKKIIRNNKTNYICNKKNKIIFQKNTKYNSFLKKNFQNNNYKTINIKSTANKPMTNFDKINYRHLIENSDNILYKKISDKSLKGSLFCRKNNRINNIKTIKKFDNRLINDKKSNKKEYLSYMNELQKNLEKSRSKSKPKSKFDY